MCDSIKILALYIDKTNTQDFSCAEQDLFRTSRYSSALMRCQYGGVLHSWTLLVKSALVLRVASRIYRSPFKSAVEVPVSVSKKGFSTIESTTICYEKRRASTFCFELKNAESVKSDKVWSSC